MIADMTLALAIMEKDYEKSGFRISLRIKTFESLKEAISRWSGQINSLPLIEPELWAYMVKKLGGLPKIREDFKNDQPKKVEFDLSADAWRALQDHAKYRDPRAGKSMEEFLGEFVRDAVIDKLKEL
jgi:hypothetical protein